MDRATFFDDIRSAPFSGRLSQSQVEGTQAILDSWAKYVPTADPRFVACSLGNAYHETAFTMQPIAEYGKGRGRAYGHPTGPWSNVYYGRGDIQETWERNYIFATTRLRALGVIGVDVNLDKTPDLAMKPEIAAPLMIYGMIEGWFTGRKLEQYFVGTRSDWVDARAIINGHDKAALIGGYCLHFYHALTA